MVSTETKEIDGHKYAVSQLTSGDGRRIFVLLVRTLGPTIAKLFDSTTETVSQSIASAINELAIAITDEDLTTICGMFGNSTVVTVDGKDQRLDLQFQELHFAGRFSTMFKWLGFCLEVNYQDFISSLASASSGLVSGDLNEVMGKINKLRSQR